MSENAIEQVRELLDNRVRVKLKDGRLIEGLLECYDKLGNMILGDSREVRDHSTFPLGLVLAPHHMVVSILVPPPTPPRTPALTRPPVTLLSSAEDSATMQRLQKLSVSGSGSSSSTT